MIMFKIFQDIDITDNPLLLKYLHHDSKIEAYFYIHQKLESVNDIEMITESNIRREFMYIRLRSSLPLIAQNGNIMEVLEESRKSVSFISIFNERTLSNYI